jgi:myo-inositol-1(or 4)-monophosphatase
VVSLGQKSEWDVAAADLILAEAGGRLTTARDEPLTFNKPAPVQPSLVAAGPALHAVLIDFLATVPRPPGARW